MRRADLERMLGAYRFPGPVETFTYFDDARGLALGAVTPAQSLLPGWWAGDGAAVASDGRVRTPEGEFRGAAAARALFAARADPEALEDMAGEFAFAAFDRSNGELTLANDVYGRGSIYYTESGDGEFAFASEAKSLLEHPVSRREISPEGIGLYLREGVIFSPYTPYAGMFQLNTGELLRRGPEGLLSSGMYWQFPPISPHPRSLESWAAELKELIRGDVVRYGAGHSPAGVMFSAGLDSSIVVALLLEAGIPVHGFTASYPPEFRSRPSDYLYARQTAAAGGFPCEEIMVTPETALPVIADVLRQAEEPNVQVQTMITFKLLLDAARPQGIDVMLTGMGTEEAYGIDFFRLAVHKPGAELRSDEEILRKATQENFYSTEEAAALLGVRPAVIDAAFAGAFDQYKPLANAAGAYDHIRRTILWSARRSVLSKLTELLAVIDPIEIRHPFNEWHTLRFVETIPSEFKGARDVSMYKALLNQSFGHLIPPWVKERDSRGLPGFVISEYRFEELERYLFSPEHLDSTGMFGGADMTRTVKKRQFRKMLVFLLVWHDIHISRSERSLELLEAALTSS